MSLYTGTVESVVAEPRQANVTTDAAAASSTLLLDNVGPFLQAGGQALVDGVLLDYLTVDADAESMTLAVPLASPVTTDSTVQAAQQGVGVIDWKVNVLLDGQDGVDDEPVPATVTLEYIPYLREGVADAGKRVTLSATAQGLYLDEIDGGVPLFDGSLLDPEIPLDPAIVPAPPPPEPVAPASSPTPVPSGGVRSILVTLPPQANDPTTRVEVYVSTTSPVTLTAGNLHGLAQGTLYEVGTLPDGTPLTDLAQGTVVYVVARAVNDAGTAAESAEASASLRPVDAEDFAVGYLYAGAVQVDQLVGGTFALGEGTVNTIEAVGVNGERVGMSILEAMGFYSFGAPEVAGQQGPVRVWFPIDGKPNIVSGQSEFDDLTVNNSATFNCTTTIAPGEALVLSGQVQAPKAAPSAVASYDTVQFTGFSTTAKWIYAGLTLGHDGNYRTVRYDSTAPYTSVVESYHPTTGALVSSTTISGFDARGGIVYSSAFTGRYYMLGAVEGVGWRIRAYDTALALVWESGAVLANTLPDYVPAIGWDHVTAGGRLLVASVANADVAPIIDTYNPTSGALGTKTSWTAPGGYTYVYDLGYVGRVTTEYGDRYVFRQRANATSFQVFTTTGTPVHQTAEEWPNANGAGTVGAWYDGTRFHSIPSTGAKYRYEYGDGRHMWNSGSANREVSYTWYDSAGTTHETTPSPKASVTMPKRARLSVTVNTIPVGAGGADDPNAARIYVGRGTGVANGSMNLEKTLTTPATAWSTDATVAQESATTHPPTTNNFPAGAASTVAGIAGTFIDATGAIPASPFRDSVDARADARITAATPGAWSTYTPTFTAPTTNPTLANFTRTGRYVQRGKQVTFTIVITCNTAAGLGTGVYEFGLPVAARDVNEVVGVSVASGPNMSGVARGITTTTVSAFRGDTNAGVSAANTALTAGGIIRINGTYEAA